MKENRLDKITDKLLLRVNRIVATAHKQYKSTNPYRKERIPDKERLYEFSQLTDEDINFARQNFPPEVVNEYFGQMEELRRRYA